MMNVNMIQTRSHIPALMMALLTLFAGKRSFAQTEFDSLKRNSQLDTAYQPSSKPTFVTEFATRQYRMNFGHLDASAENEEEPSAEMLEGLAKAIAAAG